MGSQSSRIKIDRKIIITLIIGSCVAYSGLYTMPLWIGAYTDHLSLDPSLPGYMGSVQLLCAALASIWISGRIEKNSAVKLAIYGTILVLLANVASALFDILPMLFLCRGLSGIGEGILLANLNVTISRTENPDKMFALSQTSIALFGILLFFSSPLLMTEFGIWGIFGIVVLVSAFSFLFIGNFPSSLPEPVENIETGESTKSFLSVFSSLPLLALGILFIGCQGGWAYLERMGVAKAFSVDQIGQFIMIGLLISLLGPIAANKFSSAFNRRLSIILGLFISGSAVLFASLNIPPNLYILSAAIFPFGTLFIVTSYLGYLAHIDISGKLVASAPAFINLGGAIGPALMGYVLSSGGYEMIGYVVVVSYIVTTIILIQKPRGPLIE